MVRRFNKTLRSTNNNQRTTWYATANRIGAIGDERRWMAPYSISSAANAVGGRPHSDPGSKARPYFLFCFQENGRMSRGYSLHGFA